MKTRLILKTTIAAFILASAATLRAQTWDAGGVAGGSLLWSTGTNWSADVAPVNNGTANVIFGGTLDLAPDMDANWSIASLTFNNTSGAFTLGSVGGFTLTVGAGGITNNDNNGQTINNAITLGAAQTWNSASNVIFANGALNNGGNLLTLTGTGAGLAGAVSGTGGLTVNGGTVTLSGAAANTYTGTTQVNAGLLLLQKTAGLSALGGVLTIGDGSGTDEARLGANNQIGNSSLVTVESSGLFNMFGFSDGFLQLVVNGGSTTIGTGTLTLSTSLTMTGGSVSSTTGSLVLQGLLNTNAAATSATISGNVDLAAVSRTFTVAEGAAAVDLDVSAAISNGAVSKAGAGTLRLSGANSYAGGLTLGAGTVALGSDTAAGTGTLALNGGTLVADGGARVLANAVSFANGANVIIGGTNNLTFNGAASLLAGSSVSLGLAGTGVTTFAGTFSGAGTLNTASAGTLVFSGGSANTFDNLVVNNGLVRLAKTGGVNALGANLVINSGTVRLDANNQIPDTAQPTISGSSVLDLNGFVETFGNNSASGLTLNSGGTVTSGAGTLVLNGGLVVNGGGASTSFLSGDLLVDGPRTFNVGDKAGAAIDLDVNATIATIAGGSLTKDGAGTMRIAGAGGNKPWILAAGTIALASNTALGSSTFVVSGGTIQADGGPRTLANSVSLGGNFTAAGAADLIFSGTATLTGDRVITTTNTGFTAFTGAMVDSGLARGITKVGAGQLAFGGNPANTFTGATIINEGSLFLAKPAGITAVAGPLVIGDGAGTDTVEVNQPEQISNATIVTINSSGFLNVNGGDETIGGLVLNGGSVATGAGTLTLTGNFSSTSPGVTGTVSGNLGLGAGTRTFTVANNAPAIDVDISAAITNGGLVKDGLGTLRFSGTVTNNFSLPVTVNAGELRLAKNNGNGGIGTALTIGDGIGGANADVVRSEVSIQLNQTVVVTVNSSGLLDLNGFNETIGQLQFAGGNVTTGAGVLSFGIGPTVVSSAPSGNTATLSGNVDLGGFTRTFSVADGAATTDVDVSAVISNGALAKAGAGVLRLGGNNTLLTGQVTISGGTLLLGSNTAAGTGNIVLTSGAIGADAGTRTIANNLVVNGAGAIDGAANLTVNGIVSVAAGTSLAKNGSGTFTIGPAFTTIAGALDLNAGTLAFAGFKAIDPTGVFTQNGGTVSGGTLVNAGTFSFNGGAFNGSLLNEGVFNINADFNAGAGFTNFTTITVGTNGSLSANGSGVVNEGTLNLAGGALQAGGSGGVVNNGEITGFGSILGGGGFTNNAQLSISGGSLTLGNSGVQTNAGNIDLSAGRQLRLNAALGNTGTIALAGGTIASTGTLTNSGGGTVSGRGTITAPFVNGGGTLRAEGGTLNVTQAFANSGLVRVVDGAGVAGGAITNTGRIQGDGSVANAVTNNGRIEAQGTLVMGGAVTQNAAGTIAAGMGNTVLFSTGLATNAGKISLTGGTFDNNGAALNNTGQISGFGVLATGGAGLTNNGSVTLTGGLTTISGNVTNAAGKKVETVASSTLFTGNVVNNGTFKNTDGRFTFAGNYTENGTFISDPADNYFTDLFIGSNGALIGGVGDRFIVSGSLIGASTQTSLWETGAAELRFSGAATHTLAVFAADEGASYFGYDDNFAWGTLALSGGQSLVLDEALAPGGVVYTTALALAGGLAQIASITGPGTIYYDPYLAANAYLVGAAYSLSGGGSITPIAVDLRIVTTERNASGHIVLTCLGAPSRTNRIEAVASLTPAPTAWTTIATIPAAEDGTFTFTDTAAPGFPSRFYRIAYP